MKRLVGGDYLLDLTPIAIEESEDGKTYTNITDESVIAQLSNLKTYIKNPNAIKPVWIKFNNGETNEKIVTRGQLSIDSSGDFNIVVAINGYLLKVHVEFTQVLNADDEPLDDWYIDTNDAKYLFTSDTQALAQQLADFTGDVGITGDVDITGDIAVTGKINGKIAFEDIEDANGHKRFVDGDGVVSEIAGLTSVYCKWSLSGSHLMCVFAGNVADESVIPTSIVLAYFGMPQWIMDKIYPVFATAYLETKSVTFTADDWSTQSLPVAIGKYDDGTNAYVDIISIDTLTLTKNRSFRISIDLLIDNEQSE